MLYRHLMLADKLFYGHWFSSLASYVGAKILSLREKKLFAYPGSCLSRFLTSLVLIDYCSWRVPS
jgi:hypothetical protein